MMAEIKVKKNVPIKEGVAETNGIDESITNSLPTILICEDVKSISIKNPRKINS